MRNVQEALIEGALLTVLVVFLFLNSWRSTVITGLALPVSVLASFIAVWAFGFTLNTMSLLGLSLAIGILIDDAIVVRENIVRHIEMGKDHLRASHEGTDEIGLAVAATTFSIVAVFVPVAFMYGVAGQWFKPFALTIACAVLVSLFVSFSLDPDAVGLLGRSPDRGARAAEPDRPDARALQPLVRPAGRALQGRDRLGAGPPAGDGADRAAARSSARSRCRRRLWAARASSRSATGARSASSSRRRRGRAWSTPGSRPRKWRGSRGGIRRWRYTYTTIGTPIPLMAPAVDQALIYVRLVPKAEREHQPGPRWARCCGTSCAGRRRARCRCSPAASAAP